MDVQATGKYLPISPQKLRLVLNEVRGQNAVDAMALLQFMPQKGAELAVKVLKSAMANAENNFELDPADMYISAISADEGPRRPWRRYGARGRFKPIVRRTSHLTITLSELDVYYDEAKEVQAEELEE
ncbi:MAG: 50S ribosomal protein L22 [Chloroflexota bacterium]|jgi:large subunit ribosomal protein L22